MTSEVKTTSMTSEAANHLRGRGALLLIIAQELLCSFLGRIAEYGFRMSFFYDDSLVHEYYTAADRARERHFMGNNDHGHLFICQLADDLEDLAGQRRVQGAGRLIKEKDLGIKGEGAGNRDTLLLTAGKLAGVGIPE